MNKLYSKIYREVLLHITFTKEDMKKYSRKDIINPNEYLQVATMNLYKGQTFKAHKHLYLNRKTNLTQESWCVLQGKVKVDFFDLDNSFLESVILNPGDISITLRGGHGYEVLEKETLVVEHKTGPYYSQKEDKIVINE